MKVAATDERALITSFSSTKRQILIILKREGEIDLSSLSEEIGITKMGVLNHIKDLEEMEIIERFDQRGGVGRPRLAIRLAKSATDIFPKAYSAITTSMLEFIEENMGRSAIYDALKRRQNSVYKDYMNELKDQKGFKNRVTALSKLRDQEGYMVELKMTPGNKSFELLEFNCPILGVADVYHEACAVEQELFEEVLGAKVETTHRTVAGDKVCRFLITKNK
ncbi:MAG: winged helix-turn-helix transcriptional regulator [Candidatus Heimdallarchaeota archaeon]|nr:winged helix-turn-helix transcriptional regulator [Candidatus Heimdallarchaeota archaeon]